MKAYIDCDTLMNIIRENTILTKRDNIPDGWKWFQCNDGSVVSWDFAMRDKVLVDIKSCNIIEHAKKTRARLELERIKRQLGVVEEVSNSIQRNAETEKTTIISFILKFFATFRKMSDVNLSKGRNCKEELWLLEGKAEAAEEMMAIFLK